MLYLYIMQYRCLEVTTSAVQGSMEGHGVTKGQGGWGARETWGHGSTDGTDGTAFSKLLKSTYLLIIVNFIS